METQSALVNYDGFNFGANGIVLTTINHLNIAKRENQLEKIADQMGAKLVESSSGSKSISIEGHYTAPSPQEAQLMYDILATVLNRTERPLVVPHGYGTRKYIATPENILIQQPNGLNRLNFSFEFIVPSGLSEEDIDRNLLSATVTTPSAVIPLEVVGSVDARPLITLSFGNITGGAGKSVSIRNGKDFLGLTFQRDFASNDTIAIDSANYQIYVNGDLVHPTGRMPSWSPGSGTLYYADTLTSRSVDISATYRPKNF